jgi:hypothetical protein
MPGTAELADGGGKKGLKYGQEILTTWRTIKLIHIAKKRKSKIN